MKRSSLSVARILIAGIAAASFSCQKEEISRDGDSTGSVDRNALFLNFSSAAQTLPTSIHIAERKVALEVGHDTDISSLTPAFQVPAGYSVEVNGVRQISGKSTVDFTQAVTYTLKNPENQTTNWLVEVVPLKCRVVIDASHDGGVWWFPQSSTTGFNAAQPHQGQAFANILREKGFEVTELDRNHELSDDMFFGNYIVIRVNGFERYTSNEIGVYGRLLERGMNLAFFTDHKMNDKEDELGDYLRLKFEGTVNGTITEFAPHPVTTNLLSLQYIAGSILTNTSDLGSDVQILARVGSYPVMGILKYPNSKVFFIGDSNGLQVTPQPFVNNLIGWMGICFEP